MIGRTLDDFVGEDNVGESGGGLFRTQEFYQAGGGGGGDFFFGVGQEVVEVFNELWLQPIPAGLPHAIHHFSGGAQRPGAEVAIALEGIGLGYLV